MDNKPFIQLPANQGYKIIAQEEIICICSDDKTLYITVEGGETSKIWGSMRKAEEALTHPCLVRCHQRHIVNLHKIDLVNKQEGFVVLKTGQEIPISRNYRKGFFKALENVCIKLGGGGVETN